MGSFNIRCHVYGHCDGHVTDKNATVLREVSLHARNQSRRTTTTPPKIGANPCNNQHQKSYMILTLNPYPPKSPEAQLHARINIRMMRRFFRAILTSHRQESPSRSELNSSCFSYWPSHSLFGLSSFVEQGLAT